MLQKKKKKKKRQKFIKISEKSVEGVRNSAILQLKSLEAREDKNKSRMSKQKCSLTRNKNYSLTCKEIGVGSR